MSVGLQVFNETGAKALDITDGLVRLGGHHINANKIGTRKNS